MIELKLFNIPQTHISIKIYFTAKQVEGGSIMGDEEQAERREKKEVIHFWELKQDAQLHVQMFNVHIFPS